MGEVSSIAELEKEAAAVPVPATYRKPLDVLQRFWEWQFAGPLRQVDHESRKFLASDSSRRADRKVIIVLVTVAVCLTLQRYPVIPRRNQTSTGNPSMRMIWRALVVGQGPGRS